MNLGITSLLGLRAALQVQSQRLMASIKQPGERDAEDWCSHRGERALRNRAWRNRPARHPRTRALARHPTQQIDDLRATIASKETSAQIQIMTDEGDVVTISGSSEVEATYAALRHRSWGPDGSLNVNARYREISVEREFSLTVEGDLSDEELADIKRLLDRIGPALKGLASVDGTPFTFQVDGSDFESLAGFGITVKRSLDLVHLHIRRREATDAKVVTARAPELAQKGESDQERDPAIAIPAGLEMLLARGRSLLGGDEAARSVYGDPLDGGLSDLDLR
jgi:hypothetical protein